MSYVAGSTFMVDPRNETSVATHTYVIISDPSVNPENLIAVNFTGYDMAMRDMHRNDPACLVNRGDHPYITKPTSVNYAEYASFSPASLGVFEGKDLIQHLEPVSPALLARMRKGAFDSKFPPKKLLNALKAQGVTAETAAESS